MKLKLKLKSKSGKGKIKAKKGKPNKPNKPSKPKTESKPKRPSLQPNISASSLTAKSVKAVSPLPTNPISRGSSYATGRVNPNGSANGQRTKVLITLPKLILDRVDEQCKTLKWTRSGAIEKVMEGWIAATNSDGWITTSSKPKALIEEAL